MTTASDFTRNNCILGKKRISYAKAQRDYRCAECAGRLAMLWSEACTSYPQNWHVECQACGSHDFVHEYQIQRQECEALEIIDGLPPEVAALF